MIPILEGRHLQLEPLAPSHLEGLMKAGQNHLIWTYNTLNPFSLERYFEVAYRDHESGVSQVFTVIRKGDEKILGSTRLYHFFPEHKRLSIGMTWYSPEVWGSVVNPECKHLVLSHVFETMAYNRAGFDVDSRNERSLAALKKLGITQEGILRKHMIVKDDFVRDTVVLSVLKDEWPAVKALLEKKIDFLSSH